MIYLADTLTWQRRRKIVPIEEIFGWINA